MNKMKDAEYHRMAALISLKMDLDMLNDPKQYPTMFGEEDHEAYYSMCKDFVKKAHAIVNDALSRENAPDDLTRYRYTRSGKKVPSDVPKTYMRFDVEDAATGIWYEMQQEYENGKLTDEVDLEEYMEREYEAVRFGQTDEQSKAYVQLVQDRVEELIDNYYKENPNA